MEPTQKLFCFKSTTDQTYKEQHVEAENGDNRSKKNERSDGAAKNEHLCANTNHNKLINKLSRINCSSIVWDCERLRFPFYKLKPATQVRKQFKTNIWSKQLSVPPLPNRIKVIRHVMSQAHSDATIALNKREEQILS